MARYTPVDFDPFANSSAPTGKTLTPVDHDPFAQPAPSDGESGILRRILGDTVGVDLVGRGAIATGEALVGLANIPTLGYAGKGLEAIGYDPERAHGALASLYSPERQRANAEVDQAEGFTDTAAALVQNPSALVGTVAQSIPSMLGGGAVAQALRGVKVLANPVVRGAIGEGAVMAGAQAEGIRQQTEDGTLTLPQVGLSLATGGVGALIGAAGGAAAQRFGAADLETLFAGGAGGDVRQGILRRVLAGAATEGALEEMPQSALEQSFQNVALDRPFLEGVPKASATGLLAGMATGGPVAALSRPAQPLADGEDLLNGGTVGGAVAVNVARAPVDASEVIGAAPSAAEMMAADVPPAMSPDAVDFGALDNAIAGASPMASGAAAAPDSAASELPIAGEADSTPVAAPSRTPFADPDIEPQRQFAETMRGYGVPDVAIQQHLPKAARDDVTGFFDARAGGIKVDTVKRAQQHVVDTNEPAVFVSADVFNLGGLNEHFGNRAEDANPHYRAMANILADELRASGADVVPMRTGGDETGAVAVNITPEAAQEAVARAEVAIRAYAQEQGLASIEHAKRKGEFGVGMHIGIAPIEPGMTPKQIFDLADDGVDKSKKRYSADVIRGTTGPQGAVAPEGQPGGAGSRAGAAGEGVQRTGGEAAGGTRSEVGGAPGGAVAPAAGEVAPSPRERPEAFGLPAPLKPRTKKFKPTDFDPSYDDLLDFIALNGGMHREVMQREGVDPAEWSGENMRRNQRFVGKPVFKKGLGMSLHDLRERMQEAGFLPQDPPDAPPTVGDADALDLLMRAVNGERIQTAAGREVADRIADIEREQASQSTDLQLAGELGTSVQALREMVAAGDYAEHSRELRELGAEFDEADLAEALSLVELVDRAYDAGADPTEVLDATFDGKPAEKARKLWELIKRERTNATDRRTIRVDNSGSAATPGGGQAAAAAAPAAQQPAAAPEPAAEAQPPSLTLAPPAAPPVATQTAPRASQGGLFAPPTRGEVIEAAKRDKDAERNGKTGAGRTDIMAGGGELFAGPRPEQTDIEAAAAAAATSPMNSLPEPTEAQKDAGNYKVGHLRLHGFDISIENPAGTRRRPEWPPLAHHYGYIRGTQGKDKDHVDVFIGPAAEDASLPVFVVDQRTMAGRFDEHKVMLGFADEAAARAGYLANYAPGWGGLGAIVEMTLPEFREWVRDEEATVLPAATSVGERAAMMVADIESEVAAGRRNAMLIPTARGGRGNRAAELQTFRRALEAAGWVRDGDTYRKGAGQLFLRSQGESASAIVQWDVVAPAPAARPVPSSALASMSEGELSALFDDVAAELDAVPTELPEKERAEAAARPRKPKKPTHRYDEKTLAAYFKPGRVVKSYAGWDRVIGFQWNDGNWSVTVIESNEDGTPVTGARERWHKTNPSQAELTAVLGEPKISAPKLRATRSPAEKIRSEGRSAADMAKSLGVNLSSGGVEALKGLSKLFGGPGRLNSGLTFDEQTYAQAKPHFEAMLRDFTAAGRDVRDLVREMIRLFGTGVKPYLIRFAEELRNAPGSDTNLERDRTDAEAGDGAVGSTVRAGGRGAGAGVGQGAGEAGRAGRPGPGVPDGGAAAAGARGYQPVDSGERPAGPAAGHAGGDDGRRGGGTGGDGVLPDRNGEAGTARPAGGRSLPERLAAQRAAERIPVVDGDADNIRDTLPLLLEGQQEDVLKTEARFAKADGYGILFTNGTGTGKTFTGLGVVKRFAKRGQTNILILAPDEKIITDWIKSAKPLALTVTQLPDTRTAGAGIVITTYANAGMNDMLAHRQWDLVVADEAHKLSQNAAGDSSLALNTLRAITMHPRGAYQRAAMLHRDILDQATAASEAATGARTSDDQRRWAEGEKMEAEASRLWALFQQKRDEVIAEVNAVQGAARPRVLMLSATPFAYETSIDLAEGYLFDYAPPGENVDGSRYNSGDARERFFMQHFGYRMRYNKLTKPDAKVDSGIMQRQFNAWLKQQGVLSGRLLDVDADYDRRFVLVDSAIGRRIDEALQWLRDQGSAKSGRSDDAQRLFRDVEKLVTDQFNYLSRRYLLEAIKAKESLVHVREHMALGRKVVVFHDYKKGGGFNPFLLRVPNDDEKRPAAEEFMEQFRDLVNANLHTLPSPVVLFRNAFPDVLIVNGDQPAKANLAAYERFNDDATGPQVMLVQAAKSAGWSGHDTTGKHQRVLINLGQPTKPTEAIQQEGRIYRVGQKTDAIIRYFNTGTNWERWTFATTIASRAGTAENLAMGELARALKDSIIESFEDSSADYRAGHDGEGKGGKSRDRAAVAAITEWDRAKTMYFGQRKRTSRDKSQEGVDYFATPEPLGLKMVQWAEGRAGDAALEPSAGHGAIARWFREDMERTAVEPSAELRSRLALSFGGKQTRIVDGTFEGLHPANKYDVVVMNPPFGTAGRTAIDHLAKASTHLRDGGRVVALIPSGPAADKKFDAWFYDDAKDAPAKGLALVADIRLPAVTFERAGTKVMSRVVVIEKPMKDAQVRAGQRNIDLTDIDDIGTLFDRLENLDLAPRSKPVEAEGAPAALPRAVDSGRAAAAAPVATTEKRAGEEVIEHVTGKGKTIRGVVRTGIDQAQAKEIDPYTFRKNGGWFIREKYLAAADAPRFSRRQRSAGGFLPDEQVRDIAIGQLGADASNARIIVLPFDQLPARIQEHAKAQNAPAEEIHAVHWRGVTYLVSERFTDPAAVAEAVFHEHYGHFGLRAKYGNELAPELRRLATRVGGLRAAVALAEKQGIDLTPDIRGAIADQSLSDEQRVSLIMEELLTHMAEATGSLRRMIEEAIGAVRDWLRRHGYAELATYGATDLAYILRQAREAAQTAPAPQAGDDLPRFMRARPGRLPVQESGAVAAQLNMLDALGKGQPLDRLIRKPFDVFGLLDTHGRLKAGARLASTFERAIVSAKFDDNGRMAWMNPVLETARAGLIDRYGLTAEYIQRDAEREADERRIAFQAMDIAKRLAGAGVGIAEAKVLQAVLTGEQVAEGDYVALAAPIREAVDELGREAVDLGLISPESYERNRGSYLHRVYMKHEAVLEGSRLAKWVNDGLTSRRRKIVGNSFKGRGMDLKVDMAALRRGVPTDWWRTKLEGRQADKALRGGKFIVFDRMQPVGEGTDTLPGMDDGGPRKRRILERVYWPAELQVPARFEAWENRGTWEVRDVLGGNVVLWRDFTKAERDSMGEILDARYTIAKTFQLLAHDLSTARFFADIAKNTEWSATSEPDGVVIDAAQASRLRTWAGVDWVRVPDVTIAKSRAKKYGQLSGKWVRAEIWRDISELERMQEPGLWSSMLTQWKLNKTARSPVVHTHNVLSNLVFMDMADVRLQDLARGLHAYVKDTQDYRDALEHGAFGASMITQEIRRSVLEPLLEEILEQNQQAGGSVDGTAAALSKLASRVWGGVKYLDNAMTSAYQLEDEIFRMATYMRRLSLGDTPAEAASVARDQFLNYDIRAPWVNAARRTVLPFISYTYRAVPVIARSVAHRPWKLAKYATVAYVANALAYMLAPGDEDEERRSMRPEVQGNTWIGVPRMLRMPWRDEHGMPVFLDIRRWIPAGDVFDTNQGQAAVPIPAPIQFGGPLMLGAELALNKQAFTGDPITNELTDTTGEKFAKVASWAWKSWMPGAAWIPGSWYWDKIERSLDGGRDMLGRDYSLPQALASSAGIKLAPQDVAFGMQIHAWEFQRVARELKAQARQLGEDQARGLIAEDAFNREMRNIESKFRNLGHRARETFSGSEADQ